MKTSMPISMGTRRGKHVTPNCALVEPSVFRYLLTFTLLLRISFCASTCLKADRQAEKEPDHVRSIAADVLQLHPGKQLCQDCYCCSIWYQSSCVLGFLHEQSCLLHLQRARPNALISMCGALRGKLGPLAVACTLIATMVALVACAH